MTEFNNIKFKGKSEDYSTLKSGIQRSDLQGKEKLQCIFDKIDTADENGVKDGVIDAEELQKFQELIVEFAKGGNNRKLSEKDAKRFLESLGLNDVSPKGLFELLNEFSAQSKNILSANENEQSNSQVINYTDGHTEEIFQDGSKVITVKGDNQTTTTRQDSSGKKLSETTELAGGGATVIEFDADENPLSKTVTDPENHIIKNYGYNEGEEILLSEENTETGDITKYEGNKTITTQKDGTIITTEEDGTVTTQRGGVTTTVSADGNTTTVLTEGRKQTSVKNPEDNTETITTETELSTTVLNRKDGKNISQTVVKDGQTYSVEYDGNGNTTGVVVQNGESPAAIAKRFGCKVEDLLAANQELVHGKGQKRYFTVGEEIVIPGEMNAEDFAKAQQGRKTKEEAINAYNEIVAKREQEAAQMRSLGIVNRNGAGTVIGTDTKAREDGRFANFNQNKKGLLGQQYTVIGETGKYGRVVVQGSKDGKYYTMAQDGMLLDDGYVIATNAYADGDAVSRNDSHGRKSVVVDGREYVFAQDGKLLNSDYVQATDTRDAGGASEAISGNGVTYVKAKDGTIRYFDQNGKLITGEQLKSVIKKEGQIAADLIYEAATGQIGTDEEKLAQGVRQIYSPAVMSEVNGILKSKDSDYNGDAQTTPLEALLIDELSRSEVRQHIQTLAANGAYGTGAALDTALGRNAAREIRYEVHGGVFGYTGTKDLKEAMGLASTRGARLETERRIQKEVEGEANEGSMVRQYIAEDGWDAQEVDQFDATWIKNNAYDPAYEDDQAHRNAVVGRLVFDYDNDEALHIGLESVNDAPDSADQQFLTKRAAEENEAHGYKEHFKNQDVVQVYLAGRTANEDGSVDTEHVSACNTLLFKGEKPVRIQAEEALYDAQNGDMSKMFDSMDPAVYSEMATLIAGGNVKGCKSLQETYNQLMQTTTNPNDIAKIKANAILSGQVEFTDEEVADFCVELMHKIDGNRSLGGSSGHSAGFTNTADYQTEQLKAILQSRPEVLQAVKERVNKEEFSYTTVTSTGQRGPNSSVAHTYNTKNTYVEILNDSKYTADEAIFYDENGKQITDPEQIQQLTNANMQALQGMREYVAQLEREFKKGVDAEGALADAANGLSTYIGIGTDREDVANEYRNAKLLLSQLESAAQGKLRDSEGNVISVQDLAQDVIDKQNKLEQTNTDYKTTIETGKMGIVLAPVIVATTVASGGAGAGFWTTAAIAGTATAVSEYSLNSIERMTSITGDTAEAREDHATSALIDGASTFIGAGQMKFIPKFLTNANTFVRGGGRLVTVAASDIGVGAAGEYVQTGTVSIDGVTMNAIFSVTGNLIGIKSLARNEVTPHAQNLNSPSYDAEIVNHSLRQEHIEADHHAGYIRKRQQEADKLNVDLDPEQNIVTPEQQAAYDKEIAYEAVPEADRPAFEAHQKQVAGDYAEAHHIENIAVRKEVKTPAAPKEAVDKLNDEIRGIDGQIRDIERRIAGAKRFGKDTSRLEAQLEGLQQKRTAKQAELETLQKPVADPETPIGSEETHDIAAKADPEAEVHTPKENPAANAEGAEVTPETISNDVNAIPEASIPAQHRNLWKNCKERIENIVAELSGTFSGNKQALLAKCKSLFNDLTVIANSASETLKAQINNIKSNIKSLLITKNVVKGDSFKLVTSEEEAQRLFDELISKRFIGEDGNNSNLAFFSPNGWMLSLYNRSGKFTQGTPWKMHIYADSPQEWANAAQIAMPYLEKHQIEFKTVTDLDEHLSLLREDTQRGKAFTIYFENEEEFLRVAQDLETRFKESGLKSSGQVANEAQIGDSGFLSYRHEGAERGVQYKPDNVEDPYLKMLANQKTESAPSAQAKDAPIDEIIQPSSQQRMEMGQIGNNINRANTLEDLEKAQQWLDKMPECSPKTALQNRLNTKRAQLQSGEGSVGETLPDDIVAGGSSGSNISTQGGWLNRLKSKVGLSSKIDSTTKKNLKANYMNNLVETVESNPNLVLSKRVEDAVNGKPLITDLGSNASLKDISQYVANGEVCSIGSGRNQKLYVNDNGTAVEIKLSREKFEELFPPLGTASFSQVAGTHTCTIMANLNAMLDTPSGRAKLYTMFEQNGNSITINLRGNKEPVTFPNGKPLSINLRDHNASLFSGDAPGIEMLQQAVLIDRIRVADNVTGSDVTDFSLQKIIKTGRTMAGNATASVPLLGKSGKTALYPKQISQMIENDFKPGEDIMTAIIGGQQGHDISIVNYDSTTRTVTYHDPMHPGYDEQMSLDDFVKQTSAVFLNKASAGPTPSGSNLTSSAPIRSNPQTVSTPEISNTPKAPEQFKPKTTTILGDWRDVAYTVDGSPVRARISNGEVQIEKNGKIVLNIEFDDVAKGISIHESSTGNFLNVKADKFGRTSITTSTEPEFQPDGTPVQSKPKMRVTLPGGNNSSAPVSHLNNTRSAANASAETPQLAIPKGFKLYNRSSIGRTLISTDGNSRVLLERKGKWFERTANGTLVEYRE